MCDNYLDMWGSLLGFKSKVIIAVFINAGIFEVDENSAIILMNKDERIFQKCL